MVDEITNLDEMDELKETVDRLQDILDVMDEEQAVKNASILQTCPPEEVAYAEALVGSLVITTLGTVKLVIGYYPSARKSSKTNGDEHGSEVVVELETLHAGDNEYSAVGDVDGFFIGKFEYGVATTIYGIPDTGVPNPDEWERFNFKTSSFRVTDEVEQLREKLNDGEFEDKIVGGRNDRYIDR